MTTQDDGGPAFPFTCQGPTTAPEIYYGLSMRDYFAVHIDTKDVAVSAYEALIGSFPAYADARAKIDWYAKGEAAYRYHMADAMLKARSKP